MHNLSQYHSRTLYLNQRACKKGVMHAIVASSVTPVIKSRSLHNKY
jgi:hypothetical protein